jgi:hypothetical protein
MTEHEFNLLSLEDREKAVQQHLDYLVTEGVAVLMDNGKYRMKTEAEIETEIQNIYNS